MKKLIDGSEVVARGYYYLLDWNEQNEKKFMLKEFNKHRLCDLTLSEYIILWKFATDSDGKSLTAV